MTDYVYGPLYPIPNLRRIGASHRAGWALYWAESIGAKIVTSENDAELIDIVRKGDRVFVYSGMEFPAFIEGRPYNIPRGTEAAFADKLRRFQALARKLKSLMIGIEHPLTHYADILEKRVAYPSFEPYRALWADIDFAELRRDLRRSPTVLYPDNQERLVIGDSHAISQYERGAKVLRLDGQTLYGAFKHGIDKYIDWFDEPQRVTLYFGNIDIRHHLCRPGAASPKELVTELERQLHPYRGIDITIVEPLAINDDARKIPKTGWYKGTPFYGSWEERDAKRAELSGAFSKMASRLGISYRRQPIGFTQNGVLLDTVMEKPSSVHIRPDYYRYCLLSNEWECLK